MNLDIGHGGDSVSIQAVVRDVPETEKTLKSMRLKGFFMAPAVGIEPTTN
jgi:hypothetical protein